MARMEKKPSYLIARDPSIVNIRKMEKRILAQDLVEESSDSEDTESGKLDVFLRLKPTDEEDNLYQINSNTLKCNIPKDSQAARNLKPGDQSSRFYIYSKIFPANTTQIEIFDQIVKQKVLKFINGDNSNLLTYGTSGSGKTYTIVGTNDNPGMIPQSLEYLFRTLPDLDRIPTTKPTINQQIIWLTPEKKIIESKNLKTLLQNRFTMYDQEVHMTTYSIMQKRLSQQTVADLDALGSCINIWISFAEIYNEQVFDLLECSSKAPRKKLKVFNNNGETYINNLKHIYVSNGHDAYLVLQFGLANLTYAATVINPHSSRSHCIFTITMVQSTEYQSTKYHVSHINFCDLAGSERSKITNNVGSRLNETNKINTSLLVLGRFISSIRTCQKNNTQKPISFRDSKLTQVLQKALMGKENISMIVNINQERFMFDETKRALEFSTIASGITLNKSIQHPLQKLFSLDDSEREEYKCKTSDLLIQIEEQRWHYEERESQLRRNTVSGFQDHFYEREKKWDREMRSILAEKDEMIYQLGDELDRKKQETNNISIISISSTEDEDFNEPVADLSVTTINSRRELLQRYEELYEAHEKTVLNQIAEEQKLKELQKAVEVKTNEFQQKLKSLESIEKELDNQGLDMIKLAADNEKLETNIYLSIQHNTSTVDQLEESVLTLEDIFKRDL